MRVELAGLVPKAGAAKGRPDWVGEADSLVLARAIQGTSDSMSDPTRACYRRLLPADMDKVPVISHGTQLRNAAAIIETGLKSGAAIGKGNARRALHLSAFPFWDEKHAPGMRHTGEKTKAPTVFVYLKKEETVKKNLIWLTHSGAMVTEEEIPAECIDFVTRFEVSTTMPRSSLQKGRDTDPTRKRSFTRRN